MKTPAPPSGARARARALAVAFAAAASVLPAAAADAPPPQQRIVTMTRGMKVFGQAEAALATALKSQDTAAIDRLLSPDFELRTQADPGAPVPREDWLKSAPDEAGHTTGRRDMAVHDHGDLAIVSYTALHEAPRPAAFVVDVWVRAPGGGDAWQLATRYQSGSAARAPHPRATPASGAPSSPVDPKR